MSNCRIKIGPIEFRGTPGTLATVGLISLSLYIGYRWVKNQDKCAKEHEDDSSLDNGEIDDNRTTESPKTWMDDFHENHKMPPAPPFIQKILDGCPEGYEDAMLFALLAELGALCFSKVRAKYLDKCLHSPSLLVVVEGPFGSGKAKFENVYHTLFERLITKDQNKLACSADHIIQNMGVNTSQSKFYDVTASNLGVHMFVFESEISTAIAVFKKPNGLSYEHLRKAFENGPVYQNNKSKDSVTGMFPVYLNSVFTGTPDAIMKFISKEIEGGTASRFIWTTFPESGRDIASMTLPQGDELEQMREEIDGWNTRYCYSTCGSNDVPCDETQVNLEYVNTALDQWVKFQYDRYESENNSARKDIRTRAAAIAFHCAIVLHMLWGEPTEERPDRQKAVVDMVLYIADYCLERFIQKFGEQHNAQRAANRSAEYVQQGNPRYEIKVKGVPLSVAHEMRQWYQNGVDGHGYNAIIRKWGKYYGKTDPTQIKRLFEELEKLGC